MSDHVERIRNKYIENPPDGMSVKDIKSMSDNDLLDMDFFLTEDDDLFDEDDEDEEIEGFYIF